MTTDRPTYRQTDWQQLSNALRWRDNTGRVFTEAEIVAEGGASLADIKAPCVIPRFSYASELMYLQAPEGAKVIVKVRRA